MSRKRAWNALKRMFLAFLLIILPLGIVAQNRGESTVDALVEMGFENVCFAEGESELVYVLQNSAYRLNGVGLGKAIDLVQKMGMPEDGKSCRIIVLDNNVPRISLYCNPVELKPGKEVARADWNVSYDIGESWELVKGKERENSSLFKVDVLLYPEISFRNIILSKMYEFKINLSPAVEVSLWRGSKFTAQLIIPILNEYGYLYDGVRPGFITLSQSVRLPHNIYLTGTVGLFNNDRWGVDLHAERPFANERFTADVRLSYTGWGRWGEWDGTKYSKLFKYGFDKESMFLTGSIGGSYYVPKYNTQISLHGERYLKKEYGLRMDVIRHFKYCSIGLYGMWVEGAGNDGINGGFRFQVNLPPYKYKRRGYIPRVMPSRNVGIGYNAGNEFIYGKSFKAQASENISEAASLNPYYIKSELLNF